MYAKLVRVLRGVSRYTAGTVADLCKQAADAIENTSKAYQTMAEAYEAEVTKQGWIPVTERLPEDERQVLAYYGFDHGDGYLGMMFVQVLDWFGHDPKPHFQHEGLNGMRVTHWMPLPELPKEI